MEAGVNASALIGRERELAELDRFVERAAAGPAGLVFEGEPGIGKTTLCEAGVAAALERGWVVLRARPAEAERELSFSALGDLLEPARGGLALLAAPRRRALEVALVLATEEERAAPDPRAVALATLDLFRQFAVDVPLVVAVDDTQWLDPPSRQVLEYVLRRVDGERISLLAARRPGVEDALPGECVEVGGLSVGALHNLIRGRVDGAMTRPTLVRIHETSGGNPFFALELARALEGRELRPGDPLPVPATLGGLVASRFERLDADVREVLLFVAALARPTSALVAAAAGERASGALGAAAAAGVIEADGSRLRFTHPLLASVCLGSASDEERRRVHRRLAQVVTGAEERGRQLGAATQEPDAEVAVALDDAAVAAGARGAPAAAAELAEVAVRLTPPADAAALLRRVQDAAARHFSAGSTARARSLLERALAEAPRGRVRARVALQLGSVLEFQDLAAGRPLLARALREAEGDDRLMAEIHERLASYHGDADMSGWRRHAHLAFGLAERVGDPELVARTLAVSFMGDFWAGEGIDHALIGRGIALEERVGWMPLLSRPSESYAFALKWSGEVDRARPLYERLRALWRADGGFGVIDVLFYSTYHELVAEEWEQAAGYAEEGRTLAAEAERDADLARCTWAAATVAAYRGRVEAARSGAVEAARLDAAAGLSGQMLSGLALGVLELSLGEPAPALEALRPSTQEKRSTGIAEPGLLLGVPEHVEAAIALGEHDEAEELLDWFEQHARRLDRAWALACAARGRGLLASARGDEVAADAAFARAYEQHARRPQQLATYEHARTLLVHGSILRRRQQKRQARDALGRAVAILERLGALVYAERARSELARIGGRAVAAGDELSETERQIADLVAQGRSNKEVAAALSLSPKTVEWNLSKVYAKLGVRSRAELASRHR